MLEGEWGGPSGGRCRPPVVSATLAEGDGGLITCGTLDLDGQSGKMREIKDLFGPSLGCKWINPFVQ